MLELFEFSIAFKYLIPRKKHLSVTLIAMMSVAVISLVVWLLLVFLSITEGMEVNWLKKLTDLNAPVRITPTQNYYTSYYYKIDSISSASRFALKTLGEKRQSFLSDPYDPEEDQEIPLHFQKPDLTQEGSLVDPVKGLESVLTTLQKEEPSLFYQDYEMSGALLKLQLLRSSSGMESMNFLTQVSYLATPPLQKDILTPLLIPPSSKDLNHLLFLANYRMERVLEEGMPTIYPSSEAFQEKIQRILPFVQIKTVKTDPLLFRLPGDLLPEQTLFSIDQNLLEITLSTKKEAPFQGTLSRKGDLLFISLNNNSFSLPAHTTLLKLEDPLIFNVELDSASIETAEKLQEIQMRVKGSLQGYPLTATLPWKHLAVDSFTLTSPENSSIKPLWISPSSPTTLDLPVGTQGEQGILLPKGFQDNGVMLGDRGFLSYSASTSSAIQEQRLPILVAGFYDPGVISIGNKCLLVPKNITRSINTGNAAFSFDKIALNGFQVWLDSPAKASILKEHIQKALERQGLSRYWSVTCYKDYDFAKDLLQQFQSDKLLLSLIGLIILIVACCNIISFLILLVSDKKKEIAILQAMGASPKSIALIFGLCGVFVGLLGCVIGVTGAMITLQNIDLLAKALSSLQGHDAFLPAFYGSSLPSALSSSSVLFIFIVTPLLALLSGLIPALKACRLCPSTILRSES